MYWLVPIKHKLSVKGFSKQTIRHEQIKNNKIKHAQNSLPYSNGISIVKNLMFVLT